MVDSCNKKLGGGRKRGRRKKGDGEGNKMHFVSGNVTKGAKES